MIRFFALLVVVAYLSVALPIGAHAHNAQGVPQLPPDGRSDQVTVGPFIVPDSAQVTPPTFTDAEKLELSTLVKDLEIIELKIQVLRRDFEQTRQTLATRIAERTVKGYTITLQPVCCSYEKVPEAPKQP